MSLGELIVIFMVALLVFDAKKLPVLAQHLGWVYQHIIRIKAQAMVFLNAQWNAVQLIENEKKAEIADKAYTDPQ